MRWESQQQQERKQSKQSATARDSVYAPLLTLSDARTAADQASRAEMLLFPFRFHRSAAARRSRRLLGLGEPEPGEDPIGRHPHEQPARTRRVDARVLGRLPTRPARRTRRPLVLPAGSARTVGLPRVSIRFIRRLSL